MKTKILLQVIFFLFLLSSCDLIDDLTDNNEITKEDKQAVLASIKLYSAINDSIMRSANPMAGFENIKKTLLNDPMIENVELNESGLFVKYKKGGVINWLLPIEDVEPPYWKSATISSMTQGTIAGGIGNKTVGNNKVAIVNQQSMDESRTAYIKYYDKTEKEFEDYGFEVDRINGNDVTLSFIGNDLKEYGCLFFITHGGYTTDNTWISTGQEGTFDELINSHYSDWAEEFISLGTVKEMTIKETREGESTIVTYYAFSEDFINQSYKQRDFPNSLFYLTACQALKNTSRLADAFISAGCGVFIGWNETNSRGKHSGHMLFDYLLSGKIISDAFDKLPDDAKLEKRSDNNREYTAELLFYPENKDNFYLVSEEIKSEIILTSHNNKDICTNRVQKIEGYVKNVQSLVNVVIEMNGIPLEAKTYNNTYFSQSLVLNEGENKLRIITKGVSDPNKISVQEKSIVLKGEFPSLDLFTELRWNTNHTDVDIHLLPPGTTENDLFTAFDCYYRNKSTSWNSYLDVDEVDGYGPEHITMPNCKKEGTYTLYVHYFENNMNGVTSSDVFIDVSLLNKNGVCIGPIRLTIPRYGYNSDNHGDLVKVCEITYPEGKIKIINEKVPLLKSAKIEDDKKINPLL